MFVYFNNTSTETTAGNLDGFIREQDWYDKKGIAVALNQSVIPKSEWEQTSIKENDNILVITATQGG